ncbi:unnamed protein product [Camellia sinensis]
MKYMPSTFQPEHLVELHLTYSRIEQLWEGTMHLRKLRIMNLSHSTYLKKSPYFAGVPNLERLILKGCTGLVNLHPSIGVLKRLICLNLKDCKCLKSLPDNICQLKDLGKLTLSGCSKLDKLPQDLGVLDCLYRHYADGTAIRQLPSSIGSIRRLMNLRSLTLRGCKGLSSNSWSSFFLPSILQRERDMASELAASSRLNSLQKLDLSYCNLKSIPTAICHIDSLEILDLSGNNMERLPARMNQLSRLRALWLSGCKKVQELPEISSKIVAIFAKNCSSLRTICSLSKYNYFSTLHFDNCFKLIENKQNNILTEKVLSNRFQRDASRFKIGFPGREIPKWFSHQGRGPSISFQLPPHWFNNRFLGFAFAAVGFRKDESAYFAIKMRWKCYVTKRIITSSDVLISSVNFGNILVEGIPRGAFLPFAEDCMEELKEGGIEVEVSVSNIFGVDTVSNLTLVEKVGVHVIYKEAEEQALTSRYNSQDSNNINMDVFHGDLDRSAGVQVGSSSSSATTSKRRRDDDLNDNHYNAAAGASGSPGIDDQEDHLNNLNSKRLRHKCSYVQLEGGVYKQGTRWALVRRIRDVNDCLLVKWWRRFGSEGNGLWRRLICSIYSVERGRWFPSYGANSSFSRIWSEWQRPDGKRDKLNSCKAKVRMMKHNASDQTESCWNNLWGKPRGHQSTERRKQKGEHEELQQHLEDGESTQEGVLMILIDGAWQTTTTDTGIAWICLSSGGHKLYQQALAVQPLPTPLAAEAMAYWEALRWAKDAGIEGLTIQTDCQVLVTMLQHKKEVQDWKIMYLVSDIINYSKQFKYVSICKVGRNVIQPARKLTIDVIKLGI